MRYLVALLLFIGAHFGMGALIPATGDQSTWLVPLTTDTTSWLPGLGEAGAVTNWLGVLTLVCFGIAFLGLFGLLVRETFVLPGVVAGICALIITYALWFNVWSLLPVCLCVAALAVILAFRVRTPILRRRRITSRRTIPSVGRTTS